VAASLHGEPKWTVEPGQLVGPKTPGLPLPEADPGDALTVLDFIVERDRIAFQVHSLGQGFQPLSGKCIDQLRGIQDESGTEKLLPTGHSIQLAAEQGSERSG
jgi:hypothetical protein